MQWTFAYPFETSNQEILLYYTTLSGATSSVVNSIRNTYKNAMNGAENFAAYYDNKDPYNAHMVDYGWGSNSVKSLQGLMYTDMIAYGIDPTKDQDAKDAAEGYIHYLHGVNPFNLVYLSNMYDYGAENSVNEFYHTWFTDGSVKWDRVGVSTFGPAPGFLTGGPNPDYNWDGCCPSGCGDKNAVCNSESLSPPKGQPKQKSYKDFNTSWPLNSWEVTENSCGYQINYIRLLSKFVEADYDCSGTKNGSAFFDVCNQCAGGTTGITPIDNEEECITIVTNVSSEKSTSVEISPNPATRLITIKNQIPGVYHLHIINSLGKKVISEKHTGNAVINVSNLATGTYIVIINQKSTQQIKKMIKL